MTGIHARVEARYAGTSVTQESDDPWELYADARAIQPRYETFMRAMEQKTKCVFRRSALKNPFRTIEKIGQ